MVKCLPCAVCSPTCVGAPARNVGWLVAAKPATQYVVGPSSRRQHHEYGAYAEGGRGGDDDDKINVHLVLLCPPAAGDVMCSLGSLRAETEE
ncbi:MAG: hypothetical protein G01um101430_748 [Parcubacteria group bacterium Gr01-1014_30]|nr:MAG: hypothetical protein G01um101430_748 [Parcubacteria group bacterium Gr01-1014_30]